MCLERLKHKSEDLLLLVEDEIRYIAQGGKPEVGTYTHTHTHTHTYINNREECV
jgi:hypothetical protein